MSRLLARLGEDRVLVSDGGTGALLTAAVPRLRCPEEANVRAPEAVISVHAGFIRAGSELIEANTFGANRRKLSAQFLDDRLEEIVERGVKLAREAREVAGAPVLVGGAIGPLGDLEGTNSAETAYEVFLEQARLLEGRGVDLYLVETFFDLEELETAIAAVKEVSTLPIVAQLTFDEDAAQARSLGAKIIGGCCGTTPAQIAAIRAAVEEEREPRIPLLAVEREVLTAPAAAVEKTRLERMLEAGEWVVSVELDPPKGTNMESMLLVSERLAGSGHVHEVDINDNPMARARLSALMAAVAIERRVGLETIPHVTPRDSSTMGLQSQLLGAHAEGVRNILAVTGDPPHVGDYPGSSGVYEVDSIGLTALLSHLNRGEDYSGKAIDAPTSFFVGVAVNPSAEDLELELERFRRKIDSGARFAMTQALFDIEYLDRFLERLGGESPIPLLLGVWPLTSYQLAVRLGFELARQLVEDARSRVAGIYVIPPFKEPEAALDLLSP